jgi:hypothetical protein
LWNKCHCLENISSWLRQASFRFLNSALKIEPEHRNQALTDAVSEIQLLIKMLLKICTNGKERDDIAGFSDSESESNSTPHQSLECVTFREQSYFPHHEPKIGNEIGVGLKREERLAISLPP